MTKKNELEVLKNYAIGNIEIKDFMESVEENLSGDTLSEQDLQRIKIPAGAGGTFQVPSLGEDEYEKEVTGTIIFQQNQNAYWADEYTGDKIPPTCSAKDGKHGVGDPGGDCSTCIFNQWGSDKDGVGKACKNLKTLFIITEDNMLPLVISLPPTSLGNAKKYLLQLASKGKVYWKVSTKLKLEKAKSQGGIEYMQVKMEWAGDLTPGDIKTLSEYRESILPVLQNFEVTGEAYSEADEE